MRRQLRQHHDVRKEAVGATLGLLFDDQEPELARAINDAFDLHLGEA